MAGRKKPCSAMVEVIRPQSPFGIGSDPYSFLPDDLHAPLLLLMIRLTDSADVDGVVDDFCACFHLEKRPFLPPSEPTGMQAGRCIDSARAPHQDSVRRDAAHI